MCALVFFFLSAVFLLGKDFWEKPFSEWKSEEIMKMLTKSPWSEQHVFTRQLMSGIRSSGVGGEQEIFDSYTIRLFSALPVRQAYVRMLQLNHKYDGMSPEQKQRFDADTSAFLGGEKPDIVIALDFSSNDQRMQMDVRRVLQAQTTPHLKDRIYLTTDSAGRIPLKEYFPPGQDGTGAKLIFPRSIDGKPVVTPEDKELRFDFEVPSLDHNVFVTWKVKKMIYRGKLAF